MEVEKKKEEKNISNKRTYDVKTNLNILIIMLNINYLKFPVKKQRFSNWIKKKNKTVFVHEKWT